MSGPASDAAPPLTLIGSGKAIYGQLPAARQRQFALLILLMAIGGAAEIATLGAVVPFLALLSESAGNSSNGPAVERAAIVFAVLALVAGATRLQIAKYTRDFVFNVGHDLTVAMKRNILMQPYGFHVDRNSSSLLAVLDKSEILIFHVLMPSMQAITSAFLALCLTVALFWIEPSTALIAILIFGGSYALVSASNRAGLHRDSRVISRAYDERLRVAQESLGGIRGIILDHLQGTQLRRFDAENRCLSDARSRVWFATAMPRLLIETIGLVSVAIAAIVITRSEGALAQALPVLGAVAIGALRLLPLLQQVYSGWANASGHREVVGQMIDLLNLPTDRAGAEEPVEPLRLRRAIGVDCASFRYPSRRSRAVDQVAFTVPAGSAVAIVGRTGSGKSTLADIIMGLIEPESGRILVDDRPLAPELKLRWFANIGHVPQSVFLADASIAENIALSGGEMPLDMDRVAEAARVAELEPFIGTLPDGYDTLVGERGVRLSGGQRQRIGIARALYKDTDLLVLDEALNALDEETEVRVTAKLLRLRQVGKTLIFIAHRHSTAAACDMVVRIADGRVERVGTPAEVLESPSRPLSVAV